MARTKRTFTLGALIALVLLAAAGLAGCGDEADRNTQPGPDASVFLEGSFDEIPQHPRSEPVSEKATEGDTVSRSYKVTHVTPQEVLDFYEEQLTDWQLVGTPEKIGADTVRGQWKRGNAILIISATAGPTLTDEGQADVPVTQYSLSLTEE